MPPNDMKTLKKIIIFFFKRVQWQRYTTGSVTKRATARMNLEQVQAPTASAFKKINMH